LLQPSFSHAENDDPDPIDDATAAVAVPAASVAEPARPSAASVFARVSREVG
jgi:hypothetical protein